MNAIKLVVADLVVAFLWVVSEALVRAVASYGIGEVIKLVFMVTLLIIFAWIWELIEDAVYHPITELSQAFVGFSDHSFFTVVLLISAQVWGSLGRVICVNHVMPRGDPGPQLTVGLEGGMITEGLLTLTNVLVVLFVRARGPKSFFSKNLDINHIKTESPHSEC